jgi:putative addiction module component (TIGR02574 family)
MRQDKLWWKGNTMKVETLPLSGYTLAQKLLLMEKLWAELSGSEATLPSPSWHRTILQNRAEAYEGGRIRSSPWEQAKKRIRKRLP